MGTILLVNGPNLNMLGMREKEHYGSFSLSDVEEAVTRICEANGYQIISFQSNYEGELLGFIQAHLHDAVGMLINAGAYTHYSYALYDCLKLCPYPVWEVHISDVDHREDFRKQSVIRPACSGTVSGLGFNSYTQALQELMAYIQK